MEAMSGRYAAAFDRWSEAPWASPVRRGLRFVPLLLLLGIAFSLASADTRSPRFSDRDASQHFVYALNIAESGVFSLTRPPAEPVPDAIRTPLYPAFLSLALKAGEIPPYENVQCFLARKGACRSVHTRLRSANRLAYLALIACSYLVALRVTRSVLLASLCALVTGAVFSVSASAYHSEILAAILLLLHVDGLHRLASAEAPGRWPVLEAGLAGGLLVLTTASFIIWLYLMVAVLPLVFILAGRGWRVPSPRRLGVVVLLMGLVTGTWMARNFVHGGSAIVSERGGAVMSVRAEYDAMSWREYRAAWWVFAPHSRIAYLLETIDDPDAERLLRSNPNGYYRRSRHLFMPLYFPVYSVRHAGELEGLRAANHERSVVAAQLDPAVPLDDAALQSAALRAMLANWRMHLALTPVFLVRGVGLQLPLMVLALAGIAWRRNLPMVWIVAPAIVSALFHAGITHYIPRYGWPLQPLTWLAALWAVGEIARALWGRVGRGRVERAAH
jgi:hypothetical protein